MANQIKVNDLVMKHAHRTLRNESGFVNNLAVSYDGSYSATGGAKAGSSIRIMQPQEYTVRSGSAFSNQDVEEKVVTLNTTVQRGVDVEYTSAEVAQDVDMFVENKIAPAMSTLASYIDNYAMDLAYKEIYQAVALPVTAVDREDILKAGVKLDNGSAPRGVSSRCMTLGPQAMADVVNDSSGLFNASTNISKQYNDGVISVPAMGFKFNMSQNTANHTTGTFTTGSTPLTAGVGVEAATTLATDGWAASTAILKTGDIFTIAGVNQVNAKTKASTGVLQQFVCTADETSDGSGLNTINMEPALISTGQYQNIDALPADNAAITPLGAEGTQYNQALAFHKNFGSMGFADLHLPTGVSYASRKVEDGISMRLVDVYDVESDQQKMRFDVLFGYKTVIPRWAARVYAP